MPRRKAAVKREILPDPIFNSDQIAKFINVLMRRGKKSLAERIIYRSLEVLVDRLKKEKDKSGDEGEGGRSGGHAGKSSKTSLEVMDVLDRALSNVCPTVEVKSRRVGGATYQVPVEVNHARGMALAMRWVVQAAKTRSEKTMALRLAAELHDAYLARGASVKTRDDVHRMAKANQAFAHYRW